MPIQASASIRARLMRMNLIVVIVSIALSLAGTLYFTLRSEQRALDNNLLNSASILSRVPLLRETLQGAYTVEELADYLDETTELTSDIDLILVGDTRSTLIYVPDRSLIGTAYSGVAQADALAGAAPYTSNETGPMGSDHSAYASVRDEAGEVIGFVIVGVYFRSMALVGLGTALRLLAVGVVAAVLGCLLAMRLSRSIKRSLMGYEPDAFARQFHQREDILDALEEGILAIDGEEKVIFLNAAAAEMLSMDRKTAHRLPIREDGKLAGAVSIFRNRTELTRMADDLTGVRHMVEAMRAYTHEFMNKLHVILGLLQIGEPEKAQQYIMDTTRTQREAVSRIMSQIRQPSVAALLVGKTSRANELGIRLRLDRESALSEESPWLPPEAYVTILGNLIENAIEGLNQSRCTTKEISVSIREGEDSLLLCVEDTGPGIPAELRETLFQRGVSTKGRSRGTGLSLVHEVVEAYHGEIRVESESGVGTSFFLSFCRENGPVDKE